MSCTLSTIAQFFALPLVGNFYLTPCGAMPSQYAQRGLPEIKFVIFFQDGPSPNLLGDAN
jgi:hypothetical protein